MRYDQWSYLYPPRPESAISKNLLKTYEGGDYIAQCKMNGTCSVLGVSPDRKIRAMSRHKDEHKLWSPSAVNEAAFANLPGNGWYVFVAELMHSKVKGIRNTNYIHDIMVADGQHLVGMALANRQALLASLFTPVSETSTHFVIDDVTWLAKNITQDFEAFFDSMATTPEHEGIVLKRLTAPLAMGSREKSNTNWMLKARHPHKNYGF